MGIRKTRSWTRTRFYWPKIYKDVVEFCHSCQYVSNDVKTAIYAMHQSSSGESDACNWRAI